MWDFDPDRWAEEKLVKKEIEDAREGDEDEEFNID